MSNLTYIFLLQYFKFIILHSYTWQTAGIPLWQLYKHRARQLVLRPLDTLQ